MSDRAKELEAEMIPDRKPVTDRFDHFFKQWLEWVVVFAALAFFIALVIGGKMIDDVQNVLDFIVDDREIGRENSYRTRSVACLILIIDDDRYFQISKECTEPEVVKYYPPKVCDAIGDPDGCGTKFTPSPYEDLNLERNE